jgi:hypothetical protein
MKTPYLIIALILFFTSNFAFAQEEMSARELRENQQMQEELFSTITSDRELLNNFIEHLAQDTAAIQTIMQDEDFMEEVFSRAQVGLLHDRDPEMIDMMMGQMAEMIMNDIDLQNMMMDNVQMRRMIQMMHSRMQGMTEE